MAGKQAKILTPDQEQDVLVALNCTRHPERDTVIFLLSIKAGLRAKEIAGIAWRMVCNAAGEIGEDIYVEDRVSKGRHGGRQIPMHPLLGAALHCYKALQVHEDLWMPSAPVVPSERGGSMTPHGIEAFFARLYASLGLEGCSSHSGRRTFITRAARQVAALGGSVRDVQQLAGHAGLNMTMRYIDGDSEAKRRVVAAL